MNVMFWVHDIAAALMLLFLAARVFVVIAPFSWKTFIHADRMDAARR